MRPGQNYLSLVMLQETASSALRDYVIICTVQESVWLV